LLIEARTRPNLTQKISSGPAWRQELRGRRRLSFVPTREEITRHHEPIPGEDPWVRGPPKPEPIEVVEYDPRWPARFESVTRAIRAVLGDAALAVEHVGSTSVPGLAAKPVLDVDITVSDPADEATYVPALQRAGFTLVIREPRWHQHRCLRLAHPPCNLHVFGADCPELVRHRMFREWLIAHPEDRELYCRAKLAAARVTTDRGGIVMDYNQHKEPVIWEIYERMFRAHGLLP
jgi:GrpB-like predicted nucleotidyltransferase (UPF0157 family)